MIVIKLLTKYVTDIVAKVRLPANFKLIQSYHWCIIYCCLMFFIFDNISYDSYCDVIPQG